MLKVPLFVICSPLNCLLTLAEGLPPCWLSATYSIYSRFPAFVSFTDVSQIVYFDQITI